MNTQLADELIKMARVDQDYRKGWFDRGDDPEFLGGMRRMDEMHTEHLEEIIKEYDRLTKKLVGAEASHAAWLLVQHASLELQEYCLGLMKAMPESENDPRQAAYLTDKINVRNDRPQIYGTQYVKKGEGLALYDIDDPETPNERRKKLGLGLASYVYDFEAARRADDDGTAFSSLGGWRLQEAE